MLLHVDGHAIPILTEDDLTDLTDEQRAMFKREQARFDENGHIGVRLVGSTEKATMHDVHGQGGLFDYTMVRPPCGDVPMDLASLRPFRVQGREDHQADALHQVRLFRAVGSVAVAGGHVEMAMRKVLVSLRGGQNHDMAGDDVPAEWSRLQDELERLSHNEENDLQAAVKAVLAEGEATELRERRNDVIHGYWWLIPMGSKELVAARYFHPKAKRPPANSFATASVLQNIAGRLFALAGKLEALVTPEWPLAIVPALRGYREPSGDITLRERLDDQSTKSTDLRTSNPSKPRPGQRPKSRSRRKRKNRR